MGKGKGKPGKPSRGGPQGSNKPKPNRAQNNAKRKRSDSNASYDSSKKPKFNKKNKPDVVKKILPPQAQDNSSDEDIVVSDDEAFFREHGEFVSFLGGLDASTLAEDTRKARRKTKEKEREADYETKYRHNKEWDEAEPQKKKLPLKFGRQLVEQSDDEEEVNIDAAQADDGDDAMDVEDDVDGEEEDGSDGDNEAPRQKGGRKQQQASSKKQQKQKQLQQQQQKKKGGKQAEEEDIENLPSEILELRLYMKRQQKLSQAKEKIATLASAIMESPEENIRKVKELNSMSDDEDITIKKLVALSVLAVFKDILPSYRIREEDEEKETGVKLSKDVRKLREFELTMLAFYLRYLQTLEQYIKKAESLPTEEQHNKKIKGAKKAGQDTEDIKLKQLENRQLVNLGVVAVKSMGELLSTHWHFNYRSNVIAALVPLLDSRHDELAEASADAIRGLFKADTKGSGALEAVRAIAQLVRGKSYKVRPLALQTLTSLPLKTELEAGFDIFDQKPQAGSKKHLSQKQRKQRKKDKELEKELQHAAAEQSLEEKKRMQTETLKSIFLLYFRVLKKMKNSPLLPAVLEGLAVYVTIPLLILKFSHLINIELLMNLLDVLKELILKNQLSVASSMHCIVTAFQTLKLQGDALDIDLKEFYAHFYGLLYPIMTSVSEHDTLIPLACKALELMMFNKRMYDLERVAAYVKRLLTVATGLPPHSGMALLKVVFDLLRKYPKTQQLLDAEFSGMGVYNGELDDPEHCNAFASTSYELIAMRQHYHPAVAAFSAAIHRMDNIGLSATPMKLFHDYNIRKRDFNPSIPVPKEHHLKKLMEKNTSKKGKEGNMYFVIPTAEFPFPSPFAQQCETQVVPGVPAGTDLTSLLRSHYQDVKSVQRID